MHELIAKLTKDLNLTPEQQFQVSADIKRYVHEEKAGLLYRLYLGAAWGTASGDPKYDGFSHKSIAEHIKSKYDSHVKWAAKPNEEIITWSVGSFTYTPAKPTCHPDHNSHTFVNAKVGDNCLCGAKQMEDDEGDFDE